MSTEDWNAQIKHGVMQKEKSDIQTILVSQRAQKNCSLWAKILFQAEKNDSLIFHLSPSIKMEASEPPEHAYQDGAKLL